MNEIETSERSMARLIQIIAYHLLLLAVYFNVTNSSPTMQHGVRRIGDSTITHSPARQPGVRGMGMSSTAMQPQEKAVSHTRTHAPALHLGRRIPKALNMLQTESNPEFDHSIFGPRLYHKWSVSKMKVKNCPSICTCVFMYDPLYNIIKLLVRDCVSDPADDLPKLFSSHSNVKYLELNSCYISDLPQSILKLKNLTALFLIKNNLTSLPSLQGMSHLGFLWIRKNKAELVLTDITQLTYLKMLYLTENNITALPHEIGNMRSLGILNVSYNALTSLPREIWNLTQLIGLDLNGNEILSLSGDIGALSALKYILIESNKLETLPSTIGNLSELMSLRLDNNAIKALPKDVVKLNQLEVLILSNNSLREVPNLPHGQLSILGLQHNMIETMPCEILTSHPLTELNVGYNDLRSFHCVQINNKLTALSLTHNSIEDLLCGFFMWSLKHLDLSYNNISKIREGCAPFSSAKLNWLDMSFNQMGAIHFYQFCAPQLYSAYNYLSFRNNRISTVDITGIDLPLCFQKDAIIDFANNRIYSLDSWLLLIAETVSITVDLSGNDLSKFTNSAGRSFQIFKSGTKILLQQNMISHFMNVFNGWEINVNTTAKLITLLSNVHFNLGGNPLVCDCVDYEVYKYIQTLTTEQYKNLQCHEPLTLRGQKPREISLQHFVCDIQVNCSQGCNCTKVPHYQSVDVTCRHYTHTDIPEMMPDLPDENFYYRLEICNQNLSEITAQSYLKKTIEILLSNNAITKIEINSSMALQAVKILHLDHNKLQRLPESVAGMTNSTATEVKLGYNPWVCDCETLGMKEWIMMNTHIVKDQNDITCHSPPSMVGIKVKDITRSMVCPTVNMIPVYVGAIIGIVFVLIVANVVILRKRKFTNWQPVGSDECEGEHKEFDVFMCAADGDSRLVENILIPELERRDYRVCYHREHFCGGKPIHVNMSEAIEKSKRTLVYFSNHFRDSEFSMFEFHSAYDLDIRNKTRRLVTIKDPNLDMNSLQRSVVHYFETHSYIQLEGERFWNNLEYFLAHQRLGAQVRRPNT